MANLFENVANFFRDRFFLPKQDVQKIEQPFLVPKDTKTTEFGSDWDLKDTQVVSASRYVTPYGNYYYGDSTTKSITDLILRYRDVSMLSYVSDAIDEIVNEMAIYDDQPEDTIYLEFNDPDKKISDTVRKSLLAEFNNVLDLLNFDDESADYVRQWYTEGRLVFQIVVDLENLKAGIQKIKPMSALYLSRKFDQDKGKFYWEYETNYMDPMTGKEADTMWKDRDIKFRMIPDELMVYVPSGLYVREPTTDKVSSISYLHPAMRDIYRLDVLEEHVIIFRLVRSPERRVFYIDSMDLPPKKAEEYLRQIINSYRQKKVFDSDQVLSGTRTKSPSLVEDIFLLRRNEKGTQVETLPGGTLGDLGDLSYFRQRVANALKVPYSRMTIEDSKVLVNRLSPTANEITAEEVKFMKFIKKLQNRFSVLFHKLLFRQLVYKNIIRAEEWPDIKRKLKFVWKSDAMFSEAKRIKNLTDKMGLLGAVTPYEGVYFSRQFIQRKVLGMGDEEISRIETEMQEEKSKFKQKPGEAGPGLPPPGPQPAA